MQRFALSMIAAAVCAAAAPAAHAALFVSFDVASAAPGETITIPVRITDDTGTSPLVNAFAVGLVADRGTFGASTDTSARAGLPQFLGTANFFDIGDIGDPAQGRTAAVVDNLSDATAGESVDQGQFKGLFLATFTVPADAVRGDFIGLSVDRDFTSFSTPADADGNSTLLPYDAASAVIVVTPEPASLGLLGGAAALLLRRRR